MTEDVFRDAINANPADMTLRLVYADWLEEEGRCTEAAGHRWLVENGKMPTGCNDDLAFGWRYFYFSSQHTCDSYILPIQCRPPGVVDVMSSYTDFMIFKKAAHFIGSALERKAI